MMNEHIRFILAIVRMVVAIVLMVVAIALAFKAILAVQTVAIFAVKMVLAFVLAGRLC